MILLRHAARFSSRAGAISHLERAQALQTAPFTYDLPPDRIAHHPVSPRHDSKLLVIPRKHDGQSVISDLRTLRFYDIPSILPESSLLVRNATRVIPARIAATKSTGGRAEILLLHPNPNDATQSRPSTSPSPSDVMSARAEGQKWRAILGGRKLRPGVKLIASAGDVSLQAVIEQRHEGGEASVQLEAHPTETPLRDVLNALGVPPLPPYIRRPAEDADAQSFQTTYAAREHEGSAAAPTAGLHVTPDVTALLQSKGVRVHDVVLHIGTATFRQVSAAHAGAHDMHHESIAVPGSVVAALRDQVMEKRPVVALGTTSVRTIESLYWFGVRLCTAGSSSGEAQPQHADMLSVGQWEPYEQMDKLGTSLPAPSDALSAVLEWCGGPDGHVHGGTKLLIVPGYRFNITNALITNFHQPHSTLLMLVSAFNGGPMEGLVSIYEHALTNGYRFLSYGDSSIFADEDFFDR